MSLDRALRIVPRASLPATFNDAVLAKIRRRQFAEACVQVLSEPLVTVSLSIVLTLVWQVRPLAHHVVQWVQRIPTP